MLTAGLYASVGLGGGTAYLSIISFWDSDPAILRPTAWVLNIVAASTSFVNFNRRRRFNLRLAWPILTGGVFGAAAGGSIRLDSTSFQAMLAIVLIGASLQMLFAKKRPDHDGSKPPPVLPSLLLGTVVGLLSGLVGIGGGIVLGPALIALRWVDMKTLAPITALYILLNSSGALVAFLFAGGGIDLPSTGTLCVAVLAGSFVGSRWGAEKASELVLRRIFGLVALVAGVRLCWEALGWGNMLAG
jgi:hypothetical protein